MTSALPGTTTFTAVSVAECIPNAGVDFGYCGIQQTSTKTLTLQNPHASGVVHFNVQADNCPFNISHLSGKFVSQIRYF